MRMYQFLHSWRISLVRDTWALRLCAVQVSFAFLASSDVFPFPVLIACLQGFKWHVCIIPIDTDVFHRLGRLVIAIWCPIGESCILDFI